VRGQEIRIGFRDAGNQLIGPRQEAIEQRRRVRPAVAERQLDGRDVALQRTNGRLVTRARWAKPELKDLRPYWNVARSDFGSAGAAANRPIRHVRFRSALPG
jgi:hypothetical protein